MFNVKIVINSLMGEVSFYLYSFIDGGKKMQNWIPLPPQAIGGGESEQRAA
jgi:hypothetical protein